MKKTTSLVFTLRAWSEENGWRWSLKKSDDSERIGFPDLDSLYMYLSALTENRLENIAPDYETEDDDDES